MIKKKANIVAFLITVLIILGITVKPIGFIVGIVGGIVVMVALLSGIYYCLKELIVLLFNELDN